MEQWDSALTVYVTLCRFLTAFSKCCFQNYPTFLHEFNSSSPVCLNLPNPDESLARQLYSCSLGWSQLITLCFFKWLVYRITNPRHGISVSKIHKNVCNFLSGTSSPIEIWFNDLYRSGYFNFIAHSDVSCVTYHKGYLSKFARGLDRKSVYPDQTEALVYLAIPCFLIENSIVLLFGYQTSYQIG